MKKVCVALTGLGLCTTVALAEDIAVQEPVISSEYKEENSSSFFVGMETGLISYNTVKLTNDKTDDYVKTHTLNLNKDILDGLSVLFGFNLGDSSRATFKFIQTNIETETSDAGVARYALHFDLPIIQYKNIAPFVRLGAGYISAEEDSKDLSAITFALGLGVNYNVTKNVFVYGLFNYDFMPETEIGDTDIDYKESMFSLIMGLGYKF